MKKNEAAVAMAKLSAKARHKGKTKEEVRQMYRDLALKMHAKRVINSSE